MSVKSSVVSPIETLTQLAEAARDPAGDRAGRDPERLADRPVALVPAEEAVEHLPALRRERGKRLAHLECLVEHLDRLVGGLESGGLLAPRGNSVEADAPRQLGDPGPERLRVAQRGESVVDAQEHVLEGVL